MKISQNSAYTFKCDVTSETFNIYHEEQHQGSLAIYEASLILALDTMAMINLAVWDADTEKLSVSIHEQLVRLNQRKERNA